MARSKTTFIDQAKIFVQAGNGGNGHVGFHRAKYIPRGGPDGGDGGKGGDIVFVGSSHKSTLQEFSFKKHFQARNGQPGSRAQRTGADGENIEIQVPLGTVFWDQVGGECLGEITEENERLVLEQGGRGGLGNLHFATSINQTPRKSTPGEVREGRWIRLELRLLADVGIVGLPNAGKSTLLSRISGAHPKVADYPFTTLSPTLGIAQHGTTSWSMADMPGLLEGAHEGVGLGIAFLRHIQRTRALLYVIAADPEESAKPWNDFSTTKHEIECYDRTLCDKKFLVTINKVDLVTPKQEEKIFYEFYKNGITPIRISAKEKIGLDSLLEQIHEKL